MAYSNGFDTTVVLPALRGRVGWRSSDALRKYESYHALCTEANLKAVQPDEKITQTQFDEYKEMIDDEIILRCLSSVFSKPEHIEQVLLHNSIPGTTSLIDNADKFCGIRLSIVPDRGISTNLRTVTILLNDAVTDLKIYLYKQGQAAPVTFKTVTTAAGVPASVTFDEILNPMKSTTYYVGYFQSDLGAAQAIREKVYFNTTKCVAGISFTAPKTATERFDSAQPSITDHVGLNADLVVFRDYTERIIANPHLFDEVIGLSMVYYVCEQIISSTRSNVTERILKGDVEKMQLTHYLYGAIPISGVPQIGGLKKALSNKFDDVRRSFYPQSKITVASC